MRTSVTVTAPVAPPPPPPPPTLRVSLTSSSSSCQTGGSITLSWTISGGTAPYSATISGSAASSGSSHSCGSSAGSKTFALQVTDSGSPRQSASDSTSVTVTGCASRPAKPGTSRTAARNEHEWRLSSGTWRHWLREVRQPQRRTVTWSGHPTCEWESGEWTDHGAAVIGQWQRGTDDRAQRTERKIARRAVLQPDPPKWEYVFVNATCRRYEQRKYRVQAWYRAVEVSWAESTGWTNRSSVWTAWEGAAYWQRTGEPEPCPFAGAAGAAGEQRVLLGAGSHVVGVGGVLVSVTVAEGVQVTVGAGETEEGTAVLVFGAGSGAELVVDPAALGADGAVAPASSDPVLAAVAESLRVVEEAEPAAGAPVCAEVERSGEAAVEVSLAAAECSVVAGGAVTVSDGTRSLSASLPTGRRWLVTRFRFAEDDAGEAFWFVDLGSGSFVAVDPADGAERGRHVAEGSPAEMGGWLDAIAASAAVREAEG